ncbi:MAG: ribonuclease III, partial [Anaerolineales bacterium]
MSKDATTPDILHFAHQIGLPFQDMSLLEQALTHRSYVNEHKKAQPLLQHNERLEFLGDAVIDFIAGDWLFGQFPEMREGKLTRIRSALVRTEMLASFARACGVQEIMRLGRGEEANGGRDKNSTLCNTFEAIMGALYMDQGMQAVYEFIEVLFEPALDEVLQRVSTKDAKSRLQEWSQAQPGKLTPRYHLIAALGPDHRKLFLMEV